VAGHINKRKLCAAKDCRGTIPVGTHKRCPRCGGTAHRTVWRARHPDPSKGGTAKIERTFSTRQEAADWLDDLRHSTKSGKFIDPRSKQTFRQVADEWRATWGDLKPRTKAGYDAILEKHVLPRWGKAKVRSITADRIQEWVNEDLLFTKTGRRRAPNTIRNTFNVLREVMGLAVTRRYIADNPCASVRLPRRARQNKSSGREERDKARKKMRILTPAQIKLLAEAMPTPAYRMAVYVAAHAGLRAGEVWALRREDITLDGTIVVDENLQEIHSDSDYLSPDEKGMVFGEPKSEAGDREFALPAYTLKLLTAYLSQPLPGGDDPASLILTTPSGLPVRHNLFYTRKFKPAVRKVLPKHLHGLTFHDLRHTCASLTLSVSQGNFYMVKERLGHEKIETTVDTYGHLVRNADEKLADSLSKLFETADEERTNVVSLPGHSK
jgi:integrase